MNKNEHAMFSQMKNIKNKTIWLLTEYPKTQDCDNLLYCYFIIHTIHPSGAKAMGLEKLKGMTALEYLLNVKTHGIVNFGSLSRGRRKIQEDETYKHLRGTKRDDRNNGENYWRNNINKPD